MLRQICAACEMPLAVGHVGLGERIGGTENVVALCYRVKGWKSWSQSAVCESRGLLLPVRVTTSGGQDWVLGIVRPSEDSVCLGRSERLQVYLVDRVGRVAVGKRVAGRPREGQRGRA